MKSVTVTFPEDEEAMLVRFKELLPKRIFH